MGGYRAMKGEDFLWQVMQHALPSGFRRVRDYGFLYGNAKRLLSLVQLILRVMIETNHCDQNHCLSAPNVKRSW